VSSAPAALATSGKGLSRDLCNNHRATATSSTIEGTKNPRAVINAPNANRLTFIQCRMTEIMLGKEVPSFRPVQQINPLFFR